MNILYITEIATWLKCSVPTVRRLMKRPDLKNYMVMVGGRWTIAESDLEEWYHSQRKTLPMSIIPKQIENLNET